MVKTNFRNTEGFARESEMAAALGKNYIQSLWKCSGPGSKSHAREEN